VNESVNPIELGLELLVGGIRVLGRMANEADMWREVAEAYFAQASNAEELYRKAQLVSEESFGGEQE
jgi:hypothetical protein